MISSLGILEKNGVRVPFMDGTNPLNVKPCHYVGENKGKGGKKK